FLFSLHHILTRLCYTTPPPRLSYDATTPQLSYVAPPPRRALLLLCSLLLS
ncbi:hypothetical protein HN51_001596, partial [Arachis hypogaea]